jgi:hypothetical protein
MGQNFEREPCKHYLSNYFIMILKKVQIFQNI